MIPILSVAFIACSDPENVSSPVDINDEADVSLAMNFGSNTSVADFNGVTTAAASDSSVFVTHTQENLYGGDTSFFTVSAYDDSTQTASNTASTSSSLPPSVMGDSIAATSNRSTIDPGTGVLVDEYREVSQYQDLYRGNTITTTDDGSWAASTVFLDEDTIATYVSTTTNNGASGIFVCDTNDASSAYTGPTALQDCVHLNVSNGDTRMVLSNLGDIDGDGQAELGVVDDNEEATNHGNGDVYLINGDDLKEDADFSDVAQLVYEGTRPNWVPVGDLDGDGNSDLVIQENFEGTLLMVSSSDYSEYPFTVSGVKQGGKSVASCDWNDDGVGDLAFVSNNGAAYLIEGPMSGAVKLGAYNDELKTSSANVASVVHMIDSNPDHEIFGVACSPFPSASDLSMIIVSQETQSDAEDYQYAILSQGFENYYF